MNDMLKGLIRAEADLRHLIESTNINLQNVHASIAKLCPVKVGDWYSFHTLHGGRAIVRTIIVDRISISPPYWRVHGRIVDRHTGKLTWSSDAGSIPWPNFEEVTT